MGVSAGKRARQFCQEVGTDQHQQGQDHHAEADGQYLCRAEGAPADDIHQSETAGNPDSCPQPVQAANGQPRRQERGQGSKRQSAETIDEQLPVA